MVREDDSDIKEAADTVPPSRNRHDQRSMQSTREAGEGWCLPRQVPRDDMTVENLRVQGWSCISES